MFGGNRNHQEQGQDRPILIDGRTGQVIDDNTRDTRDDRPAGQGYQDRGSARWIYGDDGRPVPYRDGDEW